MNKLLQVTSVASSSLFRWQESFKIHFIGTIWDEKNFKANPSNQKNWDQ